MGANRNDLVCSLTGTPPRSRGLQGATNQSLIQLRLHFTNRKCRVISEETATASAQNAQVKSLTRLHEAIGESRDQRADEDVSKRDKPACAGSSTPLPRFRILCSTFNVRCLGCLGWIPEAMDSTSLAGGVHGRQGTAAGEGPLGALSMSINARSGATVGQLPWLRARCSALRKRFWCVSPSEVL